MEAATPPLAKARLTKVLLVHRQYGEALLAACGVCENILKCDYMDYMEKSHSEQDNFPQNGQSPEKRDRFMELMELRHRNAINAVTLEKALSVREECPPGSP